MAKKYNDGMAGDTKALRSSGGDGAGNQEGLLNQELIDQLDCRYQKPQGREDRQAVNYENDTSGWVRGMPDACAKPGFDYNRKGK